MTRPLIIVPGTWGELWAATESPTLTHLREAGYDVRVFHGWTGNIDGTPNPFGYAIDGDRNTDWRAGGWGFRYYLTTFGMEADVLTHSHGLNVVLYQATLPVDGWPKMRLHSLTSICSPSRDDMQARAQQAMASGLIGCWHHVYAHGFDLMGRLGEAFDGHWGWRRQWPAATMNHALKGIGHTGLLEDPTRWPRLDKILARATGTAEAAVALPAVI